jgi:hypothetical protein
MYRFKSDRGYHSSLIFKELQQISPTNKVVFFVPEI